MAPLTHHSPFPGSLSTVQAVQGTPAHDELLQVINTSYGTGKLPASWKQANIVPISKPSDPEIQRPISFLSCLGKTAEKIVLAMGAIHKHLYAFTANKGTRDCIAEMLTTMSDKKAIVTFMDLEKAFELASALAILESLIKQGIRGKLLQWTKDFLTERKAMVQFQGKTSHRRTFDNGTPQGSILSPFLFNVLVENLVALSLDTETKVLCYVDDIAIITTGARYAEKAQRAITAIANECQELGLKINAIKTKAIHFGSRKILELLMLHDTEIEWVGSHPYLSVWMDLRFTKNIAATTEKAKAGMRVMRAITGLQGGASLPVFKTYYVQAVRSIIEYGASCLSTTTPTAIAALEKIQNQAMRLMVGAPVWTRICTLQVETSILPLHTRLCNQRSLPGKIPQRGKHGSKQQ